MPSTLYVDEDDEGQGERHGEVGGRGVDRERRYLHPEEVELLLRVGRQRDVTDQVAEPDEEEERPDEREVLLGHPVIEVPARDVVAHQREEDLDRRLNPVRSRLHPARDPDHRRAREDRGDHQVHHGLVDVERAGQVDPGVELELVLGLELLVVAPREAEDQEDRDERKRVKPENSEDDLVPGLHGRGDFLSKGRMIKEVAK